MKALVKAGLALSVMCSIQSTHAALITLDFDGGEADLLATPYLEDGFRLTPNCHLDITDFGNPPGDSWMGWDHSACDTPEPASVRLERVDGGLFQLLSMDVTADAWFDANASSGVSQVLIHDCGDMSGTPFLCPKTFDGIEWHNLAYVDFAIVSEFGDPQGFDNVRLVSVPEPTTLALLSLALLVLYRNRAYATSSR